MSVNLAESLQHRSAGALMVWIKICGTTNPTHEHAAAEAGADAIGMLAPSRRRIGIEQGRDIARAHPPHVEKAYLYDARSDSGRSAALWSQIDPGHP